MVLPITQKVLDAPEIRLLRQDNIAFVVTVASRAFVGSGLLENDSTTMLRIIAEVQEEFRCRDGHDTLVQSPDIYLDRWLGHYTTSDGTGPVAWFGSRNIGTDKLISILPPARRIVEFAENLSVPQRLASASSLSSLFARIQEEASRLSGDVEARLARIDSRIAELQQERRHVVECGLDQVSAVERQGIALDLSNQVSMMISGFSEIPAQLRLHNMENEEIYAGSNVSKSAILETVLDRNEARNRGASYLILNTLREIYLNEDRKRALDDALDVITRTCGDYLEPGQARRLQSFIPDMARISTRILEEDAAASIQQENFIRSASFARRRNEMRVLRRVQTAITRVREDIRPSVRDKRIDGIGIVIPLPMEPGPGCDLRLANRLPEDAAELVNSQIVLDFDPADQIRRSEENFRKGAYLKLESLTDRIRTAMGDRDDVRLSQVLTIFPPLFGMEEISRYLGAAAGRLPARYVPGQFIEILIRITGRGTFAITAPDPVFTRLGPSADGLDAFISRHFSDPSDAHAQDATPTAREPAAPTQPACAN